MTTTASTKLIEIFQQGERAKNTLYEHANKTAQDCVNGRIDNNQLRNLLDNVIWAKQAHVLGEKILSDDTVGRVATLRPRLAYMAARQERRQTALTALQQDLDPVLRDAIKSPSDLNRLYDYVAAIVAYHKYWKKMSDDQAADAKTRR